MPCYQNTSNPVGFSLSGQTVYQSEADCLQACKEGACCDGTTCSVKPQCQCDAAAGEVFKGIGTVCSPNPCVGRCCQVNGNCEDGITQAQCDERNGYLFVPGATCDSNPCPIPCGCLGDSRIPSSVSLQAVGGSVVRINQIPRFGATNEYLDSLWPGFEAGINGISVTAPITAGAGGSFFLSGCSHPSGGGWVYNLFSKLGQCGGGWVVCFILARTRPFGGGYSRQTGCISASGVPVLASSQDIIPAIQCITEDTVIDFPGFSVILEPPGFTDLSLCGTTVPSAQGSTIRALVDLRLTLHYEPPNPLP
jgi:hypothetical protein